MTVSSSHRVMVIGAGIAGLTAAWRLKRAGCDVLVLEKNSQAGGRMRSIRQDGYLHDLGASLLFSSYTHMLRLISDADVEDSIVPTSDLYGILTGDRVHHLHGRSRFGLMATGAFSTRSKMKLLAAVPRVGHRLKQLDWTDATTACPLDDEDIAAYARRRLTPELVEYFAEPASFEYSGLSMSQVSAAVLFGAVKCIAGRGMFNSPEGVQFLPDRLAKDLEVEFDATAELVEERRSGVSVSWRGPGERDRTELCDGVIIAVPAGYVPRLLPSLTEGQAAYLRAVRYSRTIKVSLGLDSRPAEQAMCLMVPTSVRRGIRHVVLDHNRAPGRVPDGAGMVTIWFQQGWSDQRWSKDDASVVQDALDDVAGLLPGVDGHVRTSHVKRWDPCTTGWPTGSFRQFKAFQDGWSATSRIHLAGDYFGLGNTNTSLASGEHAAEQLALAMRGVPSAGSR